MIENFLKSGAITSGVIGTFLMMFFCSSNAYAQGGDLNSIEDSLAIRDDIVFHGGFEEGYNNTAWKNRWGIPWIQRETINKIVTNHFLGEKTLRVSYPKGGVGPGETGTQFPLVFDRMTGLEESHFQEIYLRYYLKFEEGFDFRLGGKLPGLMGGGNSWSRSGGDQPDGTNGWTTRFMWRRNGQIVVYAYLPPSENGKWGGIQWGQDIDCDFAAEPGKWHCIEQYINVGTPGEDDGQLKVWIDGIQRLDIDDMRFWDVENDYGLIGGVYFSTFHGGNTSSWGPHVDSYAQYDGIVMARNRVGPAKRDTIELFLEDIELPEGYSGMKYRAQLLSASGGVPPYRWYDVNNELPAGLSLSREGEISGFPGDVDTRQINFQVKDQFGQTSYAETTLTISSGEDVNLANGHTIEDHSDNFDPGSPVEGLWDGDVSGELSASPGSGESNSFRVEYDFGEPCRISMVRLFGEATGDRVSKYYTVETRMSDSDEWFALTDNEDCFANQWFETNTDDSVRHIRLTVTGDIAAGSVRARAFEVYAGEIIYPELIIEDIELPEGYRDLKYRVQLSSASGGKPPYRWHDVNNDLPAGLSLSQDGKITGFPENIVSRQIIIKVEDQLGETAFADATINIITGEDVNLANGHTLIDHSDNFDPGSPVDGLWDGDASGELSASPGSGESDSFRVEYDFGKPNRISMVRLFGEATGDWVSKYYTVETRKRDSDEWFALIDNADCFAGQWFETKTDDSVRHIRLTVTGDITAGSVRARAFEVYAGDDFETTAPRIIPEENTNLLIAPNPASDKLQISFSLDSDAYVNCNLYSLQGMKTGSLARGEFRAGNHELNIDLSRLDLTGNIYIVVFSAAGDSGIIKSSRLIKVVK